MVSWRLSGFDLKDFSIFLNLQQNPGASNGAIAKQVGLSAESVRTRLQAMKDHGFLRPDRTMIDPVLGERLETERRAIYSPEKIGLKRQHVLFRGIKSPEHLRHLEQVCDELTRILARDKDDPAKPALDHAGRNGLRAEKPSADIGAEMVVPVLLIYFQAGHRPVDARVVDEDVDPPEDLHGLFGHAKHLPAAGHIRLYEQSLFWGTVPRKDCYLKSGQ